MGKLKTHSPIYCIMDSWENMLNLSHTLNKIYLTGINNIINWSLLINNIVNVYTDAI